MPGPLVTVTMNLDDASLRRIEKVCTPVLAAGLSREDVLRTLAGAEGLLCNNNLPVNGALFAAAPALRVVSGFGVGYNNVDVDEATKRGVAICNTPGVLNAAVADLTMGLILAASRGLVANVAYVRDGGWSARQPAPPLGFDIAGKTLGIVGFGRIGRAVAARARAFGVKVIFYDLFEEPGDGEEARYRPLLELMAESDIVSIHTNLTPESTHLIGVRELARMKPGAWIVNTARGPAIDEVALAAALHAGRVGGAALDVLETEPPPAGAPILSAPNTIIVPHIGSATVETRAAMLDLCLSNLEAAIQHVPPPACVNPQALDRALRR